MKLLLMLISGLSIGAIMAVAAVQLVRALCLEIADFFSEAWHSADSH